MMIPAEATHLASFPFLLCVNHVFTLLTATDAVLDIAPDISQHQSTWLPRQRTCCSRVTSRHRA